MSPPQLCHLLTPLGQAFHSPFASLSFLHTCLCLASLSSLSSQSLFKQARVRPILFAQEARWAGGSKKAGDLEHIEFSQL